MEKIPKIYLFVLNFNRCSNCYYSTSTHTSECLLVFTKTGFSIWGYYIIISKLLHYSFNWEFYKANYSLDLSWNTVFSRLWTISCRKKNFDSATIFFCDIHAVFVSLLAIFWNSPNITDTGIAPGGFHKSAAFLLL